MNSSINYNTLKTILDNAKQALFVTNTKGNICKANNTASKIFGYSNEELLNYSFADLAKNQTQSIDFTNFVKLNINPLTKFTGIHKNGFNFPVFITNTFFVDEQNGEQHYYITCNNTNHTEIISSNIGEADILEKNEAKLKAIVKNIADVITVVNKNLEVVFQSSSIKNILGYDEDELIGQNILNYIHKDDQIIVKQEFERGIEKGGLSNLIEFRFLSKNGSYVYFEANGNSQLNNPAVNGIIINSRDITTRKQIEKEIVLSRFTLNNIESSILWNMPDGTFLDYNDYAYKMLGYTKEEFKNISVANIDYNYTPELWVQHWEHLRKEKHLSFESKHIHKNGTLIDVEINANYIQYGDLELNCALVNDISNRKKVEDALQASESQIRSVFDNTEIGFILFSTDLKIVSFNGTAQQYTVDEHNKELVKDAYFLDYFSLDSRANILERVQHVLAGNKIDFDLLGNKAQDNLENWFNIKFSPVTNKNNEVVGLLMALEDISERKKIEKDLKISNERFEYVTEATFDAIWDWDLLTNHLFWGKGYHTLFGYNVIENNNYFNESNYFIHVEDRERIFESLQRAIDNGENNWNAQYRYLKSNGEYAFVEDKGVIVRNENGKAIRMIGAMQDISSQKHKEQQLKLYESVITNSTDSVLITGAKETEEGYEIVFVNEAFTKMTGYTKKEVIGKTPKLLQGPKTNKKALERLDRALKNFKPCEIEVINYKKNGEEFWVNLAIVPIGDMNGSYTNWVSIQRDTTERNKNIIEKETIFEIVKSINGSNNLEKSLGEVIEKVCRHLDFQYGEVWSLNIDENKMVFRADWSANKKIFLKRSDASISTIEKGEGLPGTAWLNKERIYIKDLQNSIFVRKESAKNAGLVSGMALPIYFNNEVVAVFNLFSVKPFTKDQLYADLLNKLTSQIGADIQKNRKELELNQFFTLSPDLLSIAGMDGYFKKINPAFSRILGYTEQELLAVPIIEFVHDDDKHKTLFAVENFQENNSNIYIENRFIAKNGELKWLAWACAPLVKEGLIFSATKDITEKKKMDDERKKLINELTSNNKELKQFSYITSHNMRAPLTNLLAIFQMLDTSKIVDEETLTLIEAMRQSTQNLNETLNDLIKILIIKENTNQKVFELEFKAVLDYVCESISSIINNSDTIIKVDFSRAPVVRFNKGYLESIFLNLITNSIKYAHPARKPVIQIEAKSGTEFIELIFKDNGLGFNEEKVKGKIFGLYQKFHNHPDSKGIGLYLVYSQVTALGGEISVNSIEGKGTTFVIKFRK